VKKFSQPIIAPFSMGLVGWLGVSRLSHKLELPTLPFLGKAAHEISPLVAGAVVALPFALLWLWSLRRHSKSGDS